MEKYGHAEMQKPHSVEMRFSRASEIVNRVRRLSRHMKMSATVLITVVSVHLIERFIRRMIPKNRQFLSRVR